MATKKTETKNKTKKATKKTNVKKTKTVKYKNVSNKDAVEKLEKKYLTNEALLKINKCIDKVNNSLYNKINKLKNPNHRDIGLFGQDDTDLCWTVENKGACLHKISIHAGDNLIQPGSGQTIKYFRNITKLVKELSKEFTAVWFEKVYNDMLDDVHYIELHLFDK